MSQKLVTTKSKATPAEYEKLGRSVEAVLINDYINLLGNTRRQIWSSFIRGVFTGLGTVIGATLIVAALLFVLKQFGALPGIGHLFTDLSHNITPR